MRSIFYGGKRRHHACGQQAVSPCECCHNNHIMSAPVPSLLLSSAPNTYLLPALLLAVHGSLDINNDYICTFEIGWRFNHFYLDLQIGWLKDYFLQSQDNTLAIKVIQLFLFCFFLYCILHPPATRWFLVVPTSKLYTLTSTYSTYKGQGKKTFS